MDRLVSLLRAADPDEFGSAVDIAVAATVDQRTGVVTVADNLGWKNVALGTELSTALALPVRVDTDSFCGAVAEARAGAATRGAALYVAIGTGIGHAWIIEGRVWREATDAASMFGELVLDPHGPRCYCSARGRLCQYAAGTVLVKMARPRALAVASEALKLAIAHALTLFNSDKVILAGGADSAAWPGRADLTAPVEPLLHPEVQPVCLRRTELRDPGNLIGAALLASANSRTSDRISESRGVV